MPKKSQNPQFATKNDLNGVEKSLKSYFNKKLEDTEFALLVRIDEKAEKTEGTLTELIKQVSNDIMTKIDSFAGKTEALEQENAAGNLRLRNHEERITKLESTQAA